MSEVADAALRAASRPGDPGYDEARRVWNGVIDRRPAVIARCAEAVDVAAAPRYATAADLAVTVAAVATTSPGSPRPTTLCSSIYFRGGAVARVDAAAFPSRDAWFCWGIPWSPSSCMRRSSGGVWVPTAELSQHRCPSWS